MYQDEVIKFDFPIGYLTKCESNSETINKVLVHFVEFLFKFGFQIKVKSNSSSLAKVSDYVSSLMNEYDSFGEKRAEDLSTAEKCKKWEEICQGCEGNTEEAAVYDN